MARLGILDVFPSITTAKTDLPLLELFPFEADFFLRCCSAATQSSVGSNFRLTLLAAYAGKRFANTLALEAEGFPSFLEASLALLVTLQIYKKQVNKLEYNLTQQIFR